MPFIPSGRKAKREWSRRREFEATLDRLIMGARIVTGWAPGLCLPTCVLLERLLASADPAHAFSLRLGALNVVSSDPLVESISFDPRTDDVLPGPLPAGAAFHAWLEAPSGELIDPSVYVTLHAKGYAVDPEEYLMSPVRRFQREGLAFIYEDVPELRLVGLLETADHLDRAVRFILRGEGDPRSLGPNVLDVVWEPTS